MSRKPSFLAAYWPMVTVAVESRMTGRRLAWMVVVPTATPVTYSCTSLAPAGIVMVAGTLATAGLSELRLSVTPPAGAIPDKITHV